MKKKPTISLTKKQYDALIATWREEYGYNMLNWPAGLREHYRQLDIVQEVKVELVQGVMFPRICNTGVSGNDYE